MTGADVLLAGFGLLAVVAALLAVTSRRVVHAALWLVLSLGGLAGVYLTMGAEVVGLVQLLIYVGAVVVLLLFALMLTQSPLDGSVALDYGRGRSAAAMLAGLAGGGLVLGGLWSIQPARVPRLGASGGAEALATGLFTSWVLPFELISVLLLAALVSAVTLSRARADRPDR